MKIDDKKLTDLHKKGLSTRKIADELGCSSSGVHKRLKELSLESVHSQKSVHPNEKSVHPETKSVHLTLAVRIRRDDFKDERDSRVFNIGIEVPTEVYDKYFRVLFGDSREITFKNLHSIGASLLSVRRTHTDTE